MLTTAIAVADYEGKMSLFPKNLENDKDNRS
jgi:hypothetical protein